MLLIEKVLPCKFDWEVQYPQQTRILLSVQEGKLRQMWLEMPTNKTSTVKMVLLTTTMLCHISTIIKNRIATSTLKSIAFQAPKKSTRKPN